MVNLLQTLIPQIAIGFPCDHCAPDSYRDSASPAVKNILIMYFNVTIGVRVARISSEDNSSKGLQ
jgi:hypothetical protein